MYLLEKLPFSVSLMLAILYRIFFFFYLLYIPNKSLYQAVFWILLISFSLFMLDLFVFLLFSYTLSILILEVGELLGISAKS